MAKYKDYSYDQGVFLPVFFDKQILPGTFEYCLNYLVDNKIDLTVFDDRYKNDETGAPAYDPRILLKIILFAYSRGITSSRKIAQCCEENIIFMALSAHTRPHFTTIADFISNQDEEASTLFNEVILICDAMGLIGREMFAVDGCKLPSNASKEWSGTKADFQKKAIERIIEKHRQIDDIEEKNNIIETDTKYIATLEKQVEKIREWTDKNEDRIGSMGKPVKSNITDNESAKMKTSKGMVQGYNGVAMVDDKHQVVVGAEAFGKGPEQDLLKPMIDTTKDKSACGPCKLRAKCLRHPDTSPKRSVAYFHGRKQPPENAMEKMKQKIDSPAGRQIYSKRLGAVEPVFGNIRHTLRLDRFSLRGKLKVNSQWLLFCTLHNLRKIHRFGSVAVT